MIKRARVLSELAELVHSRGEAMIDVMMSIHNNTLKTDELPTPCTKCNGDYTPKKENYNSARNANLVRVFEQLYDKATGAVLCNGTAGILIQDHL